jgi:hypothetical protein
MASVFDDFDPRKYGLPPDAMAPASPASPPASAPASATAQAPNVFSDFAPQKYGLTPGDLAPAASAPAGPSSYDPSWKPTGNAIWDLLTRPVAKTEGLGAAGYDYANTIADSATFGLGDRLQSAITGEDLNAIRARTAASQSNLGVMQYPAEALGYSATGGLGAEALGLRGAGLIRGVLGGATEGAVAGGVGAAGHDENWQTGALGGAVGGTAGGLASGLASSYLTRGAAKDLLAGQGGTTTPATITSALRSTRDDAYDDLGAATYNKLKGPGALVPALDTIRNTSLPALFSSSILDNSRAVSALDALRSQASDLTGPSPSAGDIQSTIKNLGKMSGPSYGADNDIAPIIKTGLENHLATAPTTSGHSLADVADLRAAANAAQANYGNARMLQDAGTKLAYGGVDPSAQLQAAANKWYDPTQPQFRALYDASGTGGGAGAAYNAAHLAGEGLEYAGASALGGPGAALGMVGGRLLKAPLGSAFGMTKTAQQLMELNQLYPKITGQAGPYATPSAGAALQALILGPAAAGQYPR